MAISKDFIKQALICSMDPLYTIRMQMPTMAFSSCKIQENVMTYRLWPTSPLLWPFLIYTGHHPLIHLTPNYTSTAYNWVTEQKCKHKNMYAQHNYTFHRAIFKALLCFKRGTYSCKRPKDQIKGADWYQKAIVHKEYISHFISPIWHHIVTTHIHRINFTNGTYCPYVLSF